MINDTSVRSHELMVVVKMVELVASWLHGYVLCRLRKALSVELLDL